MRALFIASSILLVAGCGDGEADMLNIDSEAKANRIADLAVLDKNEAAAEQAKSEPLPLQLVTDEDAGRELETGAACELLRDGSRLLMAVEGDAIAKVDGRVVHLASGSLNDSGGFFQSPQVTVSIGRIGGNVAVGHEGASRPAEVAIRKKGEGQPMKINANWHCGA